MPHGLFQHSIKAELYFLNENGYKKRTKDLPRVLKTKDGEPYSYKSSWTLRWNSVDMQKLLETANDIVASPDKDGVMIKLSDLFLFTQSHFDDEKLAQYEESKPKTAAELIARSIESSHRQTYSELHMELKNQVFREKQLCAKVEEQMAKFGLIYYNDKREKESIFPAFDD